MVAAEWIRRWRNFVNKQGPMPGAVENKPIADSICKQRMDTNYKIHDNDIKVKEPEEIFVLSKIFWMMF